jgi:RNA polymerase sigma-70 factor (ECF subfamily)
MRLKFLRFFDYLRSWAHHNLRLQKTLDTYCSCKSLAFDVYSMVALGEAARLFFVVRILRDCRFMSDVGQLFGPARSDKVANSEATKHLAALIDQIAKERSKPAFADLFRYFAPRLKGFLMRLGSAEAQAEEIVQDVMLTVWRKAHLYNFKRATPATWIFTIARNRRIDVLRRHVFTEVDLQDPALVGDDPAQPDTEIEATEREIHVRAAMQKLPDEQAELVHMAFFNDWSHSQIAEKLSLPLGTVKSRLRLAFGRLREALQTPFGD